MDKLSGIPLLTDRGRAALKSVPADLTAVCRNILVQVNGKRSFGDIKDLFKGLEKLDESIQKLISGGYITMSLNCRDIVRNMITQMLGPKAPTLLKKLDEMHAKYGDQCWNHLEELDKTARLFYGEVVAANLKTELVRIIQSTRT